MFIRFLFKSLFALGFITNLIVLGLIFKETLERDLDSIETVIAFGYGIILFFSFFGWKEEWENGTEKLPWLAVIATSLPGPCLLLSTHLYGLGTFERVGGLAGFLILATLILIFSGGIIGSASLLFGYGHDARFVSDDGQRTGYQ